MRNGSGVEGQCLATPPPFLFPPSLWKQQCSCILCHGFLYFSPLTPSALFSSICHKGRHFRPNVASPPFPATTGKMKYKVCEIPSVWLFCHSLPLPVPGDARLPWQASEKGASPAAAAKVRKCHGGVWNTSQCGFSNICFHCQVSCWF